MMFFGIFLIVLPAFGLELQLSEGELKALQEWVGSNPLNKEQAEIHYQEEVQRQTFSDLLEVYAPKNREHLKIAYASFTSNDSQGGGDDLGFGLHIVKRLELPVSAGKTRVIDVNELWGEDTRTGGLFLPDEIRIKTMVFEGPRKVPGSEKLYFFDSIRVAWGVSQDEVALYRRTKYSFYDGKNYIKAMRVPVSAPFSCRGCHKPTSRLANAFLKEGETRNYEAIVQDSHFTLPPEQMRGFQQYVDYLKASHRSPEFIEKARATLKKISQASAVPGLYDAIQKAVVANERNWLSEDEPQNGSSYLYSGRQGYYQVDGRWMKDPLEDIFEGKYRWWEPRVVIP